MAKFPSIPGYDRRAQVGLLLNRVKAAIQGALDRELAPYDLTAAQYVVLLTLASERAETGAELCKVLSYDPGAMTRMLDRVEQKKLLKRVYSQENRRRVRLELTEQGQAVYPELQARAAAVMERVLGPFSAQELDQLEGFLLKMASRLEPAG